MAETDFRKKTNIGDVLRAHRERQGLSQVELAELIGVNSSTVTRYELGEREPPLAVLKVLRIVFELTWGELLDGVE